jgi:hypothetical protein
MIAAARRGLEKKLTNDCMRRESRVTKHDQSSSLEQLNAFIGEWSMAARFPGAPQAASDGADSGARTVFEWLPGERFLVQRWEVPHPEAPDGIAIIGFDRTRNGYLQHYFDSRGVARLYEMTFADRAWRLSRSAADFSPLNFLQRYEGSFSEDGSTISGSWQTSSDGSDWKLDFELVYTRLR